MRDTASQRPMIQCVADVRHVQSQVGPATNERHRPEASVRYGVVPAGLPGFLADRAEQGVAVPGFVERAQRAYLVCGLLERGFCRFQCDGRGAIRLSRCRAVALSCNGCDFCPSCLGRRMNDGAAHRVDRVLPDVPLRQWALSLAEPLRLLCAFKSAWLTRTMDAFVSATFAFQRRRARKLGIAAGRCDGVTVVQRFGSACELNVHFHTLILDGVWSDPSTGRPTSPAYHRRPLRTNVELRSVARAAVRQVNLTQSPPYQVDRASRGAASSSRFSRGRHGRETAVPRRAWSAPSQSPLAAPGGPWRPLADHRCSGEPGMALPRRPSGVLAPSGAASAPVCACAEPA